MKKLLFFLVVTASFSTSFAQETKPSEKKTERIKVVKAGEPEKAEVVKSEKKQTPAEELKSCEAQLAAINKKETYLNEHPEDYKIAMEYGWFKDAEKNKAILLKRIEELKIELKK